MEELLRLLEQFNTTLQQQATFLVDFTLVLDAEEEAISRYHFLDIEKSVTLKDQKVRLFQSLEDKRIQLAQKICALMAFDGRQQNLSLSLLRTVFGTYLNNVRDLVSADFTSRLEVCYEQFCAISAQFLESFQTVSARIYRNKTILKKVLHHINISLNLLGAQTDAGTRYDALGKTQSALQGQNLSSSIRVTV